MNNKINDLQYSLEFTEKETKQEILIIKEKHSVEIGQLQEKMREMEDRSRRNNIRVEGVNESENENWQTTKEKFHDIIKNKLGVKNKDVVIERAHRVNRKGNNNKPRPIVAQLLNYEDKETIMASECEKVERNWRLH